MNYIRAELGEMKPLVLARLAELDPRYMRIWEAALPYQDKRNDQGHALIATAGVLELMEAIDIDHGVAIPAIMLHDIGWSQLSEDARMESYRQHRGAESARIRRFEHQVLGAELAFKILQDLGYPAQKVCEILLIITQHDTRSGEFMGFSGAVVRDADKVPWRVHPVLLPAVSHNRGWTTGREVMAEVNKIAGQIEEPSFLLLEAARQIGRQVLENLYRPAAEALAKKLDNC